jgi:hypothetical protein
MKFKLWFEANNPLVVPIARLYGWRPKMDEVLQDIRSGRLSHTNGPVTISRLDSPRGSFFVMDGHHRIVEAGMAGRDTIEAIINQYTPRIERTGGSFRDMVADKEPFTSLIQRIAANPESLY